ncbi:MAG TPA: ABC transporter permease [Solirubrobacteraceae bacterium]|jgi:ABC-type lipoprotein release transport system permease subunit
MFFTYLRREIRRRKKQGIVIALGLAIGIGLVVTVSATSAGVKTAQGKVLHSLYGIGTDITVTKTAKAGSGGPQRFRFGGGPPGGASAAHLSRNVLHPSPGQATLFASDVAKVSSLKGTSSAVGGLQLTDTSFSGTVPSSSSGGGLGGGGGASSGRSSFNLNSFTVDGVQITHASVGPLTASRVAKGKYFSVGDNNADVAIVSSSYAAQHGLTVGTHVTLAGKKMLVIGLANVSSGAANVYIPLGTAQTLSGLKGDVSNIYVRASSASSVSSLAGEIHSALPGATVSTSSSLASQVSGSLSSASSLATNLGTWLSYAALVFAFLIAGLMTMAAVSRRVREFGTLKAIGWQTRRIVGQVMGEGLVVGLAGGLGGLILGVIAAEVVTAASPSLSATVGSAAASGGAGAAPAPGGRALAAAHTVMVHLSAPLQGNTVALAVALAIAGGLVAGAFGAWRAGHLRPAAALRKIA